MINAHFRSLGLYAYKAYIANENHARSLLRSLRWPDGIRCPKCGYGGIWKMGGDWRCSGCRHHFSDISGTVFQKSHLAISQWIIAIGLWKLGINALGLSWAIGVRWEAARYVLRRIQRTVMKDSLLTQLAGEIEVDETYYGGRRKGKRGRGAAGKTIVLGFKQRQGKVKTIVIPNVKGRTLTNAIDTHVEIGSTVYTDGLPSYEQIAADRYQHLPFDHNVHFIKSPVIHTQGIEGHWGVTKPGTKARYRRITKESLPEYCAENDFKTNNRKNTDFIGLVLQKLLISTP